MNMPFAEEIAQAAKRAATQAGFDLAGIAGKISPNLERSSNGWTRAGPAR
jgi:hypothetical protein